MAPVDVGEGYVRARVAKANSSDKVGLPLLARTTNALSEPSLGVLIPILLSLVLDGSILFLLDRKRKNGLSSFEETKLVEYGCVYEDSVNMVGLKKSVAPSQVLQVHPLKCVPLVRVKKGLADLKSKYTSIS